MLHQRRFGAAPDYSMKVDPPEIFCTLKTRPSMEELLSSSSASSRASSCATTPTSCSTPDSRHSFSDQSPVARDEGVSSRNVYESLSSGTLSESDNAKEVGDEETASPPWSVVPVEGSKVESPPPLPDLKKSEAKAKTYKSRSGKPSSRPARIPTKFIWSGPVKDSVYLVGSFSDWSYYTAMKLTGEVWSTVIDLAPGMYSYKFIVDGQWTYNPRLRTVTDNHGNMNNAISVGLVPVKFVWSGDGNDVGINGSFCKWKHVINLIRFGDERRVTMMIPPGEYEYKFIVDGVWKCDERSSIVVNEANIANNKIRVL